MNKRALAALFSFCITLLFIVGGVYLFTIMPDNVDTFKSCMVAYGCIGCFAASIITLLVTYIYMTCATSTKQKTIVKRK